MILAVTFLSVISFGCATAISSQQEAVKQEADSPYVANFDYTPSSQVAPGSGGVTFAVGKVSYKSDSKTLWFTSPQFENLDKAIKQDLSELLTAKGFSVRGPFNSYDLIPYSDKKAIDLFLIATLELSTTYKDLKTEYKTRDFNTFKVSTGNVEVSGKITLELREPVSGELMWIKDVPFTNFKFPFRHSLSMNNYDDMAKGIEQQYPEIMANIAKLIDVEEIRIIKKQCQELKSKKGY